MPGSATLQNSALGEDRQRIVERELAELGDALPERLTSDERHAEPELPVGVAGVEDADDARVLEGLDEPDLAREAVGAEGVAQVGVQDLERDLPIAFDLMREIHGRHAAGAELLLEQVAAREGRVQLRDRVRRGHATPGSGLGGAYRADGVVTSEGVRPAKPARVGSSRACESRRLSVGDRTPVRALRVFARDGGALPCRAPDPSDIRRSTPD